MPVCFFLVVGLGAVFAGGCMVDVGGKKRPLLRYDKIRGELELVAEHRRDEQGTIVSRRESEALVFKERARIKTQGDIYHPDFFNYRLGFGAGLVQQRIDSDDVSGWDDDVLDEYSVSGQLLRSKPYTATFDAGKYEDLIPRQFLGSLQANRENQGAAVFLRSQSWPMMLQYSRSDISQDSFTAPAQDFFRREDERLRYSVDHDFSERSQMHFDFGRTDTRQESVGAIVETETDTYTFLHDQRFGGNEQHRLDSLLNYTDQAGTFDFTNLRWQERLQLQHSSTLSSRYSLQYVDFQRETVDSTELRGRAGIEHRLYESLVTRLDGFISRTDFAQQGVLDQHGGVLALNYRKDNPWGTLYSTYSAGLTRSDQSGGIGTGLVVDEPHIATELVPIPLDRPNVDIPTIRVKDAAGSLFQEFDDYTISVSGGRVFLNITTLGVIPPNFTEGQVFFVDYEFFVEPGRKEDTLRQSFTIRERFKNGVSVGYAHRRQDEDVTSTLPGAVADEYAINAVSADYAHKGLYLGAEYRNEDSTLIPSTSTRVEGRYRWILGSRTNATVRAVNQWLEFRPPDERDVTLFQSGAELFSRLTDRHTVSASADYRDEEDTRFGTTRGFQFDTELQYRYRQFSARLGAELSLLSRRDDEINSLFVYFQVQRRF